MEETVHTTSLVDEPICVCGYSKVGLPEADHPCPECGSAKLAVYQSSFSYTGWRMAEVGTPFALLQLFLMCFESHVPWLFFAMPTVWLQPAFGVHPISTQGDLVSRRADPPSQDRRLPRHLVSSPPLATDHESRLHRLAGDAALQPQAAADQHLDGWLGTAAD